MVIFLGKLKEDFLKIGKKASKVCSVFLHRIVRQAVEEWWITFRGGAKKRQLATEGRGDLRVVAGPQLKMQTTDQHGFQRIGYSKCYWHLCGRPRR